MKTQRQGITVAQVFTGHVHQAVNEDDHVLAAVKPKESWKTV